MSSWRIVGVSCLVALSLVLGCTNGEEPVAQVIDDPPPEVSDAATEVAQVIEDPPEELTEAATDVAQVVDPPQEVTEDADVVPQDLVGTWESHFDFEKIEGFEEMMDGAADREGMEGMELMAGMMAMIKDMSEIFVLKSDGTFVKTTSLSGEGMMDGMGMVAEGKWSSSGDQVNFYVTKMTTSSPGQEPMVQDFAGATTMPPMAMKLSEDRTRFIMATMPGMSDSGIDPMELGFYYQKQAADD